MLKKTYIIQASIKILLISILGCMFICNFVPSSKAYNVNNISGLNYNGFYSTSDNQTLYQFSQDNSVILNSTANLSLQIFFDSDIEMSSSAFYLQTANSEPMNFSLNFSNSFSYPIEYNLNDEYFTEEYSPISPYIGISFDGNISQIRIDYFISYFDENQLSNYEWVYFSKASNEWEPLNKYSSLDEDGISTIVDLTSLHSIKSLQITLISTYEDSQSEDSSRELPFGGNYLIIFAIILAAIVGGITLSKYAYREYLLNRNENLSTGVHQLTMEQVLENQTRDSILDLILDNPGIHFNEILRQLNLSAGLLAWHLDVLESYKVIRKQRLGHYLTYYSYLDRNPLSKLDLKLQKSQTALEILQIIQENPGIHQNDIAKKMGLKHNTVKYHIDKLREAEVIYTQQQGRKQLFFAKSLPNPEKTNGDSEKINNIS